MSKIARVFLKPGGSLFVDMAVPDDFNMLAWWPSVQKDGGAIAQHGIVPTDSIHHVLVLDNGATPTTLTVFPGGKPN